MNCVARLSSFPFPALNPVTNTIRISSHLLFPPSRAMLPHLEMPPSTFLLNFIRTEFPVFHLTKWPFVLNPLRINM